MRQLLTSAQVGRALGHSATWFLRRRADLEATGFPRPVDQCGMRWDPAAIEDWLDAQRRAAAAPCAASGEAVLVARARAMAACAAQPVDEPWRGSAT
jgi:predicted DNA-binding transcriptional regulator AlpA